MSSLLFTFSFPDSACSSSFLFSFFLVCPFSCCCSSFSPYSSSWLSPYALIRCMGKADRRKNDLSCELFNSSIEPELLWSISSHARGEDQAAAAASSPWVISFLLVLVFECSLEGSTIIKKGTRSKKHAGALRYPNFACMYILVCPYLSPDM